MHDGVGISLIAAGAVVALVAAFTLRTRAPGALVVVILTLCGLALGVGASLVQDRVSTTNWILTTVLLSVLVPAHVRVVLGPFGPRKRVGRGSSPPTP